MSEVADEYMSSLADLTVNSKPLINMLTMLAEENVDHAALIVETVKRHLEEVRPEYKLPALYLIDSIVKNVGGAYTQLFSQIIVGAFCKAFGQVDEKIRTQMFKLRETWHDVFPAGKLYQLDVKVKVLDPAWPIQAQPPQTNIHVNPNFFKKNPSSESVGITPEEEELRNALALKEQELRLLQKKKVEMELEQAKKIFEQSKCLSKKMAPVAAPGALSSTVVAIPPKCRKVASSAVVAGASGSTRAASANPVPVGHVRRHDPRLARRLRRASRSPEPIIQQSSLSNNKSLQKIDKSSRFSDVPAIHNDPQIKIESGPIERRVVKKSLGPDRDRAFESRSKTCKSERSRSPGGRDADPGTSDGKREKPSRSPDESGIGSRSNGLSSVLKIRSKSGKRPTEASAGPTSPTKRKRNDLRFEKRKKSKSSTPPVDRKRSKSPSGIPEKIGSKLLKYRDMDLAESKSPPPVDITFKELKISTKERNYIRRNKNKSESPERIDADFRSSETIKSAEEKSSDASKTGSMDTVGNGVTKKDVDLRVISKCPRVPHVPVDRKRPTDKRDSSPVKKNKCEKFDPLFGDEDVDLRKFPLVENLTPPPASIISKDFGDESNFINFEGDKDGGWAKMKEVRSPHNALQKCLNHSDIAKAKLTEMNEGKDRLGRPLLYSSQDESDVLKCALNFEDTDMRHSSIVDLEKDNLDETIKCILSQTEEQVKNGILDNQQYNVLLMQVLQLHETRKIKEAQQKESAETFKRKYNWKQKRESKQNLENAPASDEEAGNSLSPHSEESDDVSSDLRTSKFDIDERFVPSVSNVAENGKRPPLLPRPDAPYLDSDLRMGPHMTYDKMDGYIPRNVDMRFSNRLMAPRMYSNKGWRGMRPRMEERGGFRPIPPRGLLPPPVMNVRRMPHGGTMRMPFEMSMMHPQSVPYANNALIVGMKQNPSPLLPYTCGKTSPPPLGLSSLNHSISPVDPKILEYIEQDVVKMIPIDGVNREIRFYDDTAVVILEWDDPREISFESGQRRIYFDEESILLNLNEDYVNVNIDGHPHRVKFGAPTRELYIDDCWYECLFGGNPISIMLDNKIKRVKLEGPLPQVNIGKIKRTDLVAGMINLIIDAKTMIPIFLDAKPQKFEIENVVHTLRFVDSLQTVLINEKPFKVEFGGLPKPLFVGKRKHFIRFSVLPRDIKIGHTYIKNMEGKKPAILPTPLISANEETHFPSIAITKQTPVQSTIDSNINNPSLSSIPNIGDVNEQNYELGKDESNVRGGLDVLASLLTSSMAPVSQFAGYSVADSNKSFLSNPTSIPGLDEQKPSVSNPNISNILQNKNVNDLLSSLVASGVLSTISSVTSVEPSKNNDEVINAEGPKPLEKNNNKNSSNVIKPVDLLKSESLKTRQPDLIALLHTGMQCGSCGARFPPEHTVRYSQHLDWHFRQNRADRHSQRRPNSRKWYYDISDWIQYQEIEDLEEREKSWFEREQQAAEAAKSEEAAVVAARRETSSVPLPSGAPPEYLRCHLCHDNFHQFYNHDADEWNLGNAVEFEGNNYHPICLDDYKTSLVVKENEKTEEDKDESSVFIVEKESNETLSVCENEDVSMKEAKTPAEIAPEENVEHDSESIVEVLSEEAITQGSSVDDLQDVEVLEEDDDVVIKNEPIEQIILDDDADTDEETLQERQNRNAESEIPVDFANIKIKEEPVDPDDDPIITSEDVGKPQADTTHASVLSSIDGNVQLEPTTHNMPVIPAGGIRINITKPLISQNKDKNVASTKNVTRNADESHSPGEEPQIAFKLKSSLEGINFNVQPPTQRGSELSGLCSIM